MQVKFYCYDVNKSSLSYDKKCGSLSKAPAVNFGVGRNFFLCSKNRCIHVFLVYSTYTLGFGLV